MKPNRYQDHICNHYVDAWVSNPDRIKWSKGPTQELPANFCVLKFPPREGRNMWTYATCGMSIPEDKERLEIHLFSAEEDESLVELLYAITHFHRNGAALGLGHTVNFGQPWQPNSVCTYGLISLPYLDGETLEWMDVDGMKTRFLWLIPITKQEVEFKKKNGLDALEEQFSKTDFNYLNPARESVI